MTNEKSPAIASHPHESALDPISRISETLFGLIMVLSFTCSLSIAEVGREDVREMLIAALGCNVAWGIIDAFFYLMTLAGERGRDYVMIEELKRTNDPEKSRVIVQKVVPDFLIGSLTNKSVAEIREHLLNDRKNKSTKLLHLSDLKGAFLVFAIVFLSTFPVAIPFIVMHDPIPALRVSNGIALMLMFGLGASLGRYAGRRALTWGLGMVVVGSALVSMTISLGG